MRFEIKNLGPVRDVKFDLKDFTVLTGQQSSGKSTIAKTIYFFRTIKDSIEKEISPLPIIRAMRNASPGSLKSKIRDIIADKYDRIFEGMTGDSTASRIRCEYSDGNGTYIEVANELVSKNSSTYRMKIHISQNIIDYLDSVYERDFTEQTIHDELADLFCDHYETIYIPASRSMTTTLGTQLISFISGLNDDGRRMIDPCTMDFLQMIIQLREYFSEGLHGIEKKRTQKVSGRKSKKIDSIHAVYCQAEKLSYKILNGNYYALNGSEQLALDNGSKIKINQASSGQQEALWIINILFYYLFIRKTCFIIEEPESHLFPESQKYMTDFIILAFNQGNQIIVTTHSPYILEAADVSMFAGTLEKKRKINKDRLHELVSKDCELQSDRCNAFFVQNGIISDIIDPVLCEMDQAQLDSIAQVINDIYNGLVNLEQESYK